MPSDMSPNNLIFGPMDSRTARKLATHLLALRIPFTARPLLPSLEWEIELLRPVSADMLFRLSNLK